MKKQNKDNERARKQLRRLKEKYELTWPQMAKVFGISLPTIEAWYVGNRNISQPSTILIQTYLENPPVFKKQIKNL